MASRRKKARKSPARRKHRLSGTPAEHAEHADERVFYMEEDAKRAERSIKSLVSNANADTCASALYDARSLERAIGVADREVQHAGEWSKYSRDIDKAGQISGGLGLAIRKACFKFKGS
jgi:hypothetical protein